MKIIAMTNLGWITLLCISTWMVILTWDEAAIVAWCICAFIVWRM